LLVEYKVDFILTVSTALWGSRLVERELNFHDREIICVLILL
jgi:hypothetical protein